MKEYHVIGFSKFDDYVDWLEEMNESAFDYVIDFVSSTSLGHFIFVTFHFECSPADDE